VDDDDPSTQKPTHESLSKTLLLSSKIDDYPLEIETKQADDKTHGESTKAISKVNDEIPTDLLKSSSEEELRHRLCESSKRVVEEGEKNVSLAQELQTLRDDLSYLRNENEETRIALLKGINDGTADPNKFSNVPLLELFRIRLQEYQNGSMASTIPFFSFKKQSKMQKIDGNSSKHQQDRKEHKHDSKSVPPSPKKYVANVGDLKEKLTRMNDRSRKERDAKSKLHEELTQSNKKNDVLSDHIEKLMVHLKHEAISKAKALGDRMRSLREIDHLKKRSQMMEKRNERKDKAICDLKEGSKILEDQLRLMDEKYVELKIKLDWTRTQTERAVKKKEDEVRELRAKFILVTDLMTEKGSKNKVIFVPITLQILGSCRFTIVKLLLHTTL
jgi:hypothetical protein